MKAGNLFRILLILTSLVLFSGCRSMMTNLTPTRVKQNPSGLYPFRLRLDYHGTQVLNKSIKVSIVINGETYAMTQNHAQGNYVYEYELKADEGQTHAKYYYIVEYQWRKDGITRSEKRYSTDYSPDGREFRTDFIGKYVKEIESYRAPVGYRMPILGRGFADGDKILVSGKEVESYFISSNQIDFIVPALTSGKSYEVKVKTASGSIHAGMFKIDSARLSANLMDDDSIIATGEKTQILFKVDFDAPPEGLPIKVVTDIPTSIIMPEVIIPGGSNTVSVSIEGAAPGEGKLYIEADGFEAMSLPITVE